MRRLLCLAAALALTACAQRAAREETFTAEAPLTIARDPLLRNALRELERAGAASARVVELRGELAGWLAAQGYLDRAHELLAEPPVRQRMYPKRYIQVAFERAWGDMWREARRATIARSVVMAGCVQWAAPEDCDATLRALTLVDAYERLGQIHDGAAMLHRCTKRDDHACALKAARSFDSPHQRFNALLLVRSGLRTPPASLSFGGLRQQLALLPGEPDAAWIALALTIVEVGDEAEIAALLPELRGRAERSPYVREQLRPAPAILIERGLMDSAARMIGALGVTDDRERQQQLAVRVALEPTRATLNALLQDAPPSAQRSLLLAFARRVASDDLALAALALSFAHDDDAEIEPDEAYARVFVAATALNKGEPHKELLAQTYAAFPAETQRGAALRIEFARLTASAKGGAQRLHEALRLIDPAWQLEEVASLMAPLLVAYRQIGDDTQAEALRKRLISQMPTRQPSSESSTSVYDADALKSALHALMRAGATLDAVALLRLPMRPHDLRDAAHALRLQGPQSDAVIEALGRLIQEQSDDALRLELLALFVETMRGTPQLEHALKAPVTASLKDGVWYVDSIAQRLANAGEAALLLSWALRITQPALRELVYAALLNHAPLNAAQREATLTASEALLRSATLDRPARLPTPLANAYAEAGRCQDAHALLARTKDSAIANSNFIAQLIAPCARAGQIDAAHKLALDLTTPEWRAEALIWLLRVRPAVPLYLKAQRGHAALYGWSR